MEKLVIFSSGFPLAPLPSTLAEPAALVKMRTISHRKPGPWGLSFLFQEQCLNSSQPPRAARGWGAGPVKAIWAPGTFKMMQGAAVWRAASLGKAQRCHLVLASIVCSIICPTYWIFLPCPIQF